MLFTFVILATSATLAAAQLCGTASNCVESRFDGTARLQSPVNTNQFFQVDDSLATRSSPGNWQISSNGYLIENSFIGPARRVNKCGDKDLYGTMLLFKRANNILQLARERWYFRVKFELRDLAGFAGAVFAYKGPNNHFRVSTRVIDQCISLQKKEDGRFETLARGRVSSENPLQVNRAYELIIVYSSRDIQVQLVDSATRKQVAGFVGLANKNDLRDWHNLDVGAFSASNRKAAVFRNWMLVSDTRVARIKQFPIIRPESLQTPPDTTTTCTYSAWTQYTECSESCGGGVRSRFRLVTGTGVACVTEFSETVECNTNVCPVEPALTKKQLARQAELVQEVKDKRKKINNKLGKVAEVVAKLTKNLEEAVAKEAKKQEKVDAFATLLAAVARGEAGRAELKAALD